MRQQRGGSTDAQQPYEKSGTHRCRLTVPFAIGKQEKRRAAIDRQGCPHFFLPIPFPWHSDLTALLFQRLNAPGNRQQELEALLRELTRLRRSIAKAPASARRHLSRIHPHFQRSAGNLLHYLALRRADRRPLQVRLAVLGLSSLGRAESHVLGAVDAVLDILRRLLPQSPDPGAPDPFAVDFFTGQRLLEDHANQLLGPTSPNRRARIMVSMPTEAARDPGLIQELLSHGMDCMRINCAHDDPAAWTRMIEHLRQAETAAGRSCRIVMDLGGPKLRTGPVEPGPSVLRARPKRDAFGRVVEPARICLTAGTVTDAAGGTPRPDRMLLPVSADWLAALEPGDIISFRDAREARRTMKVTEISADEAFAEIFKTCYFAPGLVLQRSSACSPRKGGQPGGENDETRIGPLPPQEAFIILHKDDLLRLIRDQVPGRPAQREEANRAAVPATIGCTLPEAFESVESGQSIWLDDGRIGGVIEQVYADHVDIRITHARPKGEKLGADKGINLPDSLLRLPAVTERDLKLLPFVAAHVDIVELSFVNSARDVADLQSRLATLGPRQPSIVVKIETRRAFENLPEILLTAMRSPCCGVMIARGDLAVECGFERLAEVQEEILWICEAAHVPVIWATQVLETLAKDGRPSRAEITDAAMGHRAECVMLNKGPHVVRAVSVLDDILRRMQAHQTKKRSMMRKLRLARPFADLKACGT